MVAGPAVGGILFAIHPELVYIVGIGLAVVALVCALALRWGREPGRRRSGPRGGARRRPAHPEDEGAARGDLARSLRRPARGRGRAAPDLREGHPRGRADGPRVPSRRARGGIVPRGALPRPPPDPAAGGRTLFLVVAGFGACMVVFGLSREMWLSMLALALGGGFDLVSMVLRSTILPLVTPDELRGRVNAVEMVFISASNELGAFESGVAAALSARCRRSSSEGSRRSPSRSCGGASSRARARGPPRRASAREPRAALRPLKIEGFSPPGKKRPSLTARPARSRAAPTLRIDASMSSIGWSAGSGRFTRRRACETWTRQPGFALGRPGRPSPAPGPPSGRRARARPRAARRCRSRPSRSRAPAPPARRRPAPGSGRARSRRRGEPLCVAEVTRVLESNRERERVAPRAGRRLREDFADVTYLRGEGGRALVAEQPAELFQMGPAA